MNKEDYICLKPEDAFLFEETKGALKTALMMKNLIDSDLSRDQCKIAIYALIFELEETLRDIASRDTGDEIPLENLVDEDIVQ